MSGTPETDAIESTPSKRARWLKRFVAAFVIYNVVGFLVMPPIIKWQARKRLAALTQRVARVDEVRVNPYTLSLTLYGVVLTEPDGATFASFSNLYVNFEPGSTLWNRAWTFKQIRLGTPYGYVAILTNGQFNFANLLTDASSPKTSAPAKQRLPPAVIVQSLTITNGTVAVADFYRPVPFQTRFTPIDLRLTNFATRPRSGSPYAFVARSGEDEFFKWSGRLTAEPPSSSGEFELGGIDLQKYGTYLREFLQFDVRTGKATVAATYEFLVRPNGLDFAVTNATVLLTNLQVFPPGSDAPGARLVSLPQLAVRGASADLRARAVAAESVESADGSIKARRFRDGTLDLFALGAPPPKGALTNLNPPGAAASEPSLSRPWSFRIDTLEVRNYKVRIEDEQPPVVTPILADNLNLLVHGLSNISNAPVLVQFSARVNEGGTLKVDAEGMLLPLALDANIDAQSIELRPFQPYVDQQEVKLVFGSGHVSSTGRAFLGLGDTNFFSMKYLGDVVVQDFFVFDRMAFQEFARWKQIAVRGLDFVSAPMSLRVKQIACDEMVTSVVVGTNRQLAAFAVLQARTNGANVATAMVAAASTNRAETAAFPLQVDLIAFTNGSIRFADLSMNPACRFAVEQFSGTVKGLSSTPGTAADVDIRGRVNEGAPFVVSGKLNPLGADLFVDLVFSNSNTELTPFTPYLEKFAGHPLQKGKLTVGLKYEVRDKELRASHTVVFDQLSLGQRNNSPDASKLPVKVAVGLLKDRNGRIVLDIPVNGRLDDPKFKVGPIIWQGVMNLLTKAATSPFTMLGALVGGGGEELGFVEFAPGKAIIPPSEFPKLEKVGAAIRERPALNLEMTGSVDDSVDRAALAWLKLQQQLRMTQTPVKAGAADEEARIEPREYVRFLRAQYKKTFGRDRPLRDSARGAVGAVHARAIARPSSLPRLAVDDVLLEQMESDLHAKIDVTADDLAALMQARAQSVQYVLLKTEKIAAERLFILAPPPPDTASRGHSRVNLSLN